MLISFTADPLANLKEYIFTPIVLGMGMAGITMRYTRTMMLEVLRQDYVRTAGQRPPGESGRRETRLEERANSVCYHHRWTIGSYGRRRCYQSTRILKFTRPGR